MKDYHDRKDYDRCYDSQKYPLMYSYPEYIVKNTENQSSSLANAQFINKNPIATIWATVFAFPANEADTL